VFVEKKFAKVARFLGGKNKSDIAIFRQWFPRGQNLGGFLTFCTFLFWPVAKFG
jgi:hypothetical protein